MTSFRRSDTAHPFSKKSRYFYYKGEQRPEQDCCHHCGTEDYHYCNDQCNEKCDYKCDKCDKCTYQYDAPNNNQFEHFTNSSDPTVAQEGDQYSFMDQESAEMIWVKESCNITVNSTDTQAGISLQAGLQLAITLVLNIAIGDSDRSESVSQELFQRFNTEQINKQKVFICNTKDATVTTTDTDLVLNVQVLLQLLVALVVMIDIL